MEIMKITETWVKLPQGGSFIYEYKTTGSLFEIKTNNVTVTSDISHKLYIPEDVDVEIRSISGEKEISFIPLDSIKPTKEFLEKYGDLLNLINEKTQEQNTKIDNISKELESKTELLANIEDKADRADLESFKDTINQNQARLQRELLSHSELIDSKIGESRVKELISDSEINALTLRQVQQEITKNIADKVSSRELSEINQTQDIKIEANRVEVEDLKDSINNQKLELQEGLQSLEVKIDTKLDEKTIKALIAEAELNDLTLEEVQQEVIKRVADKASTEAVNEANRLQDIKIDSKADTSYVEEVKESLQNKDTEIEQSLATKASVVSLNELKKELTSFIESDNIRDETAKNGLEEIKDTLTSKVSNAELSESLQNKVNVGTFNQKVDEITQSIETKAGKIHTHFLADVVGLTEALSDKVNNTQVGIKIKEAKEELTRGIQSKANSVHNHAISDIAGLGDKLATLVSKESLQEQLQSQSELINAKLDEETVRRLIAEAELDDLTLEQVQQEVVRYAAARASEEVTTEANEAQNARIEAKADITYVNEIKQSLENKASVVSLEEVRGQLTSLIESGHLKDETTRRELQEFRDTLENKVSITELSSGLQNKVNTSTFIQRVGELTQNIETKADRDHRHSLADITGLTVALDDRVTNIQVAAKIREAKRELNESIQTKSDKVHTHQMSDVEGLSSALDNKANITHTHSLDDITGLNAKLSTLASSEFVNTLQEQVESYSGLISNKLDEGEVKALIAEAKLDNLTLEQVQQEIITRVADKASTQAMTEANQEQDIKIETKADTNYVDSIKRSLESKDREIEQSLTGKANSAHVHSFNDITDKPSTYTPSEHNHTVDDITGLTDRLSAMVTDESLQSLLKQYSPITVKTAVEELQNSLETKASNTQIESLRELIQSVSNEISSANIGSLANRDEVNRVRDELYSLISDKVDNRRLATYMTSSRVEELLREKVSATTQINVGNGLSGGGRLSDSISISLATPSKITATSRNSVSEDTHNHEIDKASDTVAGIVKLSHKTKGKSKTVAASEYALAQVVEELTAKIQKLSEQVKGAGISLSEEPESEEVRSGVPDPEPEAEEPAESQEVKILRVVRNLRQELQGVKGNEELKGIVFDQIKIKFNTIVNSSYWYNYNRTANLTKDRSGYFTMRDFDGGNPLIGNLNGVRYWVSDRTAQISEIKFILKGREYVKTF